MMGRPGVALVVLGFVSERGLHVAGDLHALPHGHKGPGGLSLVGAAAPCAIGERHLLGCRHP